MLHVGKIQRKIVYNQKHKKISQTKEGRGEMMWKMIHKRWLSLLVFGADMVTRFAASNKCIWYLYQEEIPKDAVKLKK